MGTLKLVHPSPPGTLGKFPSLLHSQDSVGILWLWNVPHPACLLISDFTQDLEGKAIVNVAEKGRREEEDCVPSNISYA